MKTNKAPKSLTSALLNFPLPLLKGGLGLCLMLSGCQKIDSIEVVPDTADIQAVEDKAEAELMGTSVNKPSNSNGTKGAPNNGPTATPTEEGGPYLQNGNTPLHEAVIHSDPEGIKILTEMGNDINAENDNGETPLVMAALNQKYDLVLILLEYGANPAISDHKGNNLQSLVSQAQNAPSPSSEVANAQALWLERIQSFLNDNSRPMR